MKPNDFLRASIKSDYQTAVDLAGASRNYSPSRSPLNSGLHIARFKWTATGTLVKGDTVTLGSLGQPKARVIPELSRIRGTGTGTTAVKFTLRKTLANGATPVALAAKTEVSSATVCTTLAAVAGYDPVLLNDSDVLQLLLNHEEADSNPTLAATNTFVVEVAYTVE